MDKDRYVEQELFRLTKFWLSFGLTLGAFVFVSLSILDYFVTPDNFLKFLSYRLVCAFFMFLMFLFNRKSTNKISQNILLVLAIIVASSTVELMILSYGGHQSTYYAGMIITVIFLLGITPLPFKMSLFLVSITYSIYLFPILIFDHIINMQLFISNNAFLLSIVNIALIWRYLSQRSITNELSLQYELNEKNKKLEDHSTQLEELVQERTKELKKSESMLKKSESMLRSLFKYATDGIIIMDGSGKIIDVNQKACDIYGFDKDAVVGSNIKLLETDKDNSLFRERMQRILNGESLLFETRHYRKDRGKVSLEVTAKAIEVEGNVLIQSFIRDITEKKMLQEQLLQAQKMESIGALAGGIAHNFNNLLTAILGNAELLHEHSHLDDKPKKRIKNIENTAKKAGMLVSKLLSFARKDRFELIPLNLNDVINDSVLFEGTLGRKIKIKMNLSDDLPTIEGDHNQIEQVIMNLIVNARDAMPDGGLITITTSTIEVKKDALDIPAYIMPGKYVLLTVSDTGCGIPKETTNRIFEPFFTTKEKDKGTGLGLATVYGIIKDHKGYITVQSEVGKGSTFDIYLPVSGKTVYEVSKPELSSLEGYENILVVDDEEDVLDFIKDVLETHGYKVMPTNNPLFAIDIFNNLSNEIHLVITDIVMPLMEGKELIGNLRTIKPDIKIIAVSGYSEEVIDKDKLMIDAFIKKPFEGSQMLSTVRCILDAKIRNLPL